VTSTITKPSYDVVSTVELLSIGVQNAENLFKFYTFYKDQRGEAGHVAEELEELLTDFRTILHDLRSEGYESK
jgi:hypothetical protein